MQETFHQPFLVTDGFHALQAVQEITPNLLLLDYHLPGMDGIELYDHLHAVKRLEETPWIMISAHLPTEALVQRSLVGSTKPFELDELLETVEQLLA